MTRMTGPDCAVMCNLINTHRRRKVEKSCVTPAGTSTSLTSRMNKMTTHKHTHTHMPGGLARRHDVGPPVEGNLRQVPGVA